MKHIRLWYMKIIRYFLILELEEAGFSREIDDRLVELDKKIEALEEVLK